MAANLKADLAKLTSSAAVEVEQELDNIAARRKELSSKNVSKTKLMPSCAPWGVGADLERGVGFRVFADVER